MPNFERLDAKFRTSYLQDKLNAVKVMGYTYISEAIYSLYYESKKSLQEIADLLGYSSEKTITRHMDNWGWKRRGPGGPNFKGRKK